MFLIWFGGKDAGFDGCPKPKMSVWQGSVSYLQFFRPFIFFPVLSLSPLATKPRTLANLLSGILTVALCAAAFFLAWRAARRERFRTALLLLLAGGLLLRIYAATSLYLHEWDERYHALVAKNLASHPLRPTLYEHPVLPYDYRDWSGNHIWLHKQPAALWLMALGLKLFGISEIALRLPSMLFSTLAIWLTYGIARHYTDKKTALLAAFLHAIHGLAIELTGGRAPTDHIDLFFLFFIELGVFFSVRFLRRPQWPASILIGLSTGLAVLTKWLPALIVLPVWGLLALRQFRWQRLLPHLLAIGGAAAAVFLPWQFYIFEAFPREAAWEQEFNLRHFFEGLEGHAQPWYFHLQKMGRIFGELIYLPLAWLTYKRARQLLQGKKADLSLLAWIWIPYIFFSIAHTKMQAYTLFCAPAFFILTALFFRYLNIYKRRFRFPQYTTHLALALLILLPVRYSIERIKPFSLRERSPAWAEEMKALKGRHEMDERTVVFGVEKPIEFMFYTGATAYPLLPEAEVLDSLARAGYGVYRYERGALIKLGD